MKGGKRRGEGGERERDNGEKGWRERERQRFPCLPKQDGLVPGKRDGFAGGGFDKRDRRRGGGEGGGQHARPVLPYVQLMAAGRCPGT